MNHSSHTSAVDRAVTIFKTQKALADALDVSTAAVGQWRKPLDKGGRPVPPKRAVQIEFLTGGMVLRRDLRPFDWMQQWPELQSAQEVRPDIAVGA